MKKYFYNISLIYKFYNFDTQPIEVLLLNKINIQITLKVIKVCIIYIS